MLTSRNKVYGFLRENRNTINYTSCLNYILALKPMLLFTDSDAIMNYTSALASESKHRTLDMRIGLGLAPHV